MTVSNDKNKAGPFVGDDAVTSFAFTYKVFSATDLLVVLLDADNVESTLVYASDYTVALNSDQDASPGGTISYPISGDPLATDEYLTTYRQVDLTQESDIGNLGGFYPDVIENMNDRVVMMAQQNEERSLRSLRLSPGASVDQVASMEIPASTRSKFLTVDSAGEIALSDGAGTVTVDAQYHLGDVRRAEFAGGADPTGVADSTAAFQAAVDSSYGVYVPYGNWRIDGTITIDKEKVIQCERGTPTPYRFFTNPSQWPFDFSGESRCRFFKDDASDNSPFFKIRWGRVYILGFPLLDVYERTSFTSAGVLYACNEDNPNSSTGYVRGSQGDLEIMAQGNVDTLPNAGEGMKAIQVEWDSPANANAYLSGFNWKLFAQQVHSGIWIGPFDAVDYQWCNTITCDFAIWNAKRPVYNASCNLAKFRGIIQAGGVLHATEWPQPAFELVESAARCTIDCVVYDMSSEVDGNGNYRISYYIKNEVKGTKILTQNGSATYRSLEGLLPTGLDTALYAPIGVLPKMSYNNNSPQNGLIQLWFDNVFANLNDRSTLSYDCFEGQAISSDTAVSDAVFSNTSGNSVDITSALGAIPTLVVGAKFDVTDHSTPDNNGEFEVTAVITNGYTCDKLNYGTTAVRPPSNAAAEAITVTTGFGALVTDSVTAGITVSTDWTDESPLSNVAQSWGTHAACSFDAAAVTDVDYIEFRIEGLRHNASSFFFSFQSNGGWTKVQVIKLGAAGVVVDNVTVDAPLQADEDPADLIRVITSSDAALETVIRFIGPKDSTKGYVFSDFAAVGQAPQAEGHVVTQKGGHTIIGDMVFESNMDLTGLPTSDPTVAGRLWNNSGVLTVSAG